MWNGDFTMFHPTSEKSRFSFMISRRTSELLICFRRVFSPLIQMRQQRAVLAPSWKPWADYNSDMLGLILSFSRRVKSLGIIWVSIVWKGSLGTPRDEWWRCPKLLTSSRLYFLIPMHWFGTTSDHQSLMEWQPEDPINSSHWKLGRWQSLYIACLCCVQIVERSLQAVWIPR